MNLRPDLQQARAFLEMLDPDNDKHTFQTFSDIGENFRVARVLHGSLSEHERELERLNERGAGVFVTINETNGRGRTKSDIIRIRAVFVDLDGQPLPKSSHLSLLPHVAVCSSPERYHLYWFVRDVPLEAFPKIQAALAHKYGSDPSVKDTSRVMRLPGFLHQKGAPHLVKIIEVPK